MTRASCSFTTICAAPLPDCRPRRTASRFSPSVEIQPASSSSRNTMRGAETLRTFDQVRSPRLDLPIHPIARYCAADRVLLRLGSWAKSVADASADLREAPLGHRDLRNFAISRIAGSWTNRPHEADSPSSIGVDTCRFGGFLHTSPQKWSEIEGRVRVSGRPNSQKSMQPPASFGGGEMQSVGATSAG